MGTPIPRPTPRPTGSALLWTGTVPPLPGCPDVVLTDVLAVVLDTVLDDVVAELVVLDDDVAVEEVVVAETGSLVMLK